MGDCPEPCIVALKDAFDKAWAKHDRAKARDKDDKTRAKMRLKVIKKAMTEARKALKDAMHYSRMSEADKKMYLEEQFE